MHLRRILLAFSLAASAASVAFADLVELNQADSSSDRIEQLTRTLSQGAYSESNDIDIPAETKLNVKIREKSIELNNATIAKKYGSSNSSKNYSASSNNPYSWLIAHPLPDMKRVSSNYGGRTMGGRAENHSGLDLSAASGTPIYATGPGIVTKSGWGTGYGRGCAGCCDSGTRRASARTDRGAAGQRADARPARWSCRARGRGG